MNEPVENHEYQKADTEKRLLIEWKHFNIE